MKAANESRHASNLTVRLPDGRHLGYAERGSATGAPLFFFHGTPGARTVLPAADPIAESVGVRIIAPERPGYGLSSSCPSRTIGSWADDVAALANHLGIDRFSVAGASGGGPYALACAARLPNRITSVGLVCTAGRFEGTRQLRELSMLSRLKFAIPRWMPWLLHADLALCAPLVRRRPQMLARLALRGMRADAGASTPDLERERVTRIAALLSEAFRHGADGLYTDLVLASRDWDIALSDVVAPVHLWHGERDTLAPVAMALALADALPNCTTHLLPDAGHLILGRPDEWRVLFVCFLACVAERTLL